MMLASLLAVTEVVPPARPWWIPHLLLCSQPSRGRLLRLQFAERERELRRHVRTEQLTPAERAIDAAHSRAVERGHFTYDDPETGLRVLTRLRHFLRGSCCGNACRHCVYGHEAVPAEVRARRRFNSAFWVDRPPPPGEQRLRSDDPDDVDFV